MKKAFIICLVLSICVIAGAVFAEEQAAAPAAPAPAAQPAATDFTLARMEIAGSVENHEPVGIAASFPATQERVSCFLEFRDVKKPTTINVVWTLGQNEMAKVPLTVKAMSKYRTWANKTIAGLKGDWKVDVVDESGKVLKTATFKIE
jgi:hypothetical protein